MEETLRTDGQTRASVPELDGCLGGERLLGSEFGARGRRSALVSSPLTRATLTVPSALQLAGGAFVSSTLSSTLRKRRLSDVRSPVSRFVPPAGQAEICLKEDAKEVSASGKRRSFGRSSPGGFLAFVGQAPRSGMTKGCPNDDARRRSSLSRSQVQSERARE